MPSNALSRVLCVDDDKDACEMLSMLMNSYRIHVTCAQSAAEAWRLIKAERFDLYMLDTWLPQTDGFEFCRQIRELDSVTPILFYSGAAYEADKQMGIAVGANAYLTKPDVEGIIETVVDLIAKAKVEEVARRRVVNQFHPPEKSLSARYFSVAAVRN
jgi:DNA-binding response OmpR family regulator